jgi:hypothetical protein
MVKRWHFKRMLVDTVQHKVTRQLLDTFQSWIEQTSWFERTQTKRDSLHLMLRPTFPFPHSSPSCLREHVWDQARVVAGSPFTQGVCICDTILVGEDVQEHSIHLERLLSVANALLASAWIANSTDTALARLPIDTASWTA